QTPGSGISIPLAVGTPSTGSGNLYCQWELSPGSGNALCILFPTRIDRLRLPEELNSVHDTFHVSNLKKCLADANLHVSLDEIKVDKTLHFVKEPVKIMDLEIKKLKHRKIALVKVIWNSKRSPEFTWEH
nr:putative reverse transcriptase domain-containing protein [Tanacetum cinerariifolium]